MATSKTEQFISKARLVHGDKYDYSMVVYVKYKTPVHIVCPIHGSFYQTPASHLSNKGCPQRGRLRTIESLSYTTESYIKKAKEIHGDKYDYSQAEYVDYKTHIKITCPKHGDFLQRPFLHLKGYGCVHCGCSGTKRRILYGVAFVDIDNANSVENRKSYQLWCDMIGRCYSPYIQKRLKTYRDCTVCEEWLVYSKFKDWFDINYIEGYDLDKDLLVKGNKIYSPCTCCFIPHSINTLIINCKNKRGEYPIGVSFDKERGKFHSTIRIHRKSKGLGRFNTANEAFLAYKFAKEQHIKEQAEKYLKEGSITEKVYKALIKYEVFIND